MWLEQVSKEQWEVRLEVNRAWEVIIGVLAFSVLVRWETHRRVLNWGVT